MNNWNNNNNKNMTGNAVQEIKLQKWQREKQQYESIVLHTSPAQNLATYFIEAINFSNYSIII